MIILEHFQYNKIHFIKFNRFSHNYINVWVNGEDLSEEVLTSNPIPGNKGYWYKISSFPKNIQAKEKDSRINERWELKEESRWLEGKEIPAKLSTMRDDNIYRNLYNYKYDIQPGKIEDISFKLIDYGKFDKLYEEDFKLDINELEVFSSNEFEKPDVSLYNIATTTLSDIVAPKILIGNFPCKLSSNEVFILLRKTISKNLVNSSCFLFNSSTSIVIKKQIPRIRIDHKVDDLFNFKTHYFCDQDEHTIFQLNREDCPEIIGQNAEDLKIKTNEFIKKAMAKILSLNSEISIKVDNERIF